MTPLRWNWSANTLGSPKPATDTMVEHRSLPPSPPWAGRDGEGDRAARVVKGQRGAAIDDRAGRSPFSADNPALAAATISKMPLNPLLLPAAHNSTGSATTINLPINEIYPLEFQKRPFFCGPAGTAHAVQIAWRSIIRICRSSHHGNFDGRSCSRGFDSKADGPDLREGCRLDR